MPELLLSIEQDYGHSEVSLVVTAGNIKVEILIPDARKPIPITPQDRAVMETIRNALRRMGAARGMLYGRYAEVFQWALAQHVILSRQTAGPTVAIAGIEVASEVPIQSTGYPHVKRIGVAT